MKCLKEKCNFSYLSEGYGYCNECDLFVINDECVLPNRIKQIKEDLLRKCKLFEEIIDMDYKGRTKIKLNPYNWQDVEYWFENEPEIFQFMVDNEDMIIKYSLENGMVLKNGIEYLFKVRD